MPAGVGPGDAATRPLLPIPVGRLRRRRTRSTFATATSRRWISALGRIRQIRRLLLATLFADGGHRQNALQLCAGRQHPSPGTPHLHGRGGWDISRFFWTEAEKSQFASDYVQRVSDRWSFFPYLPFHQALLAPSLRASLLPERERYSGFRLPSICFLLLPKLYSRFHQQMMPLLCQPDH